MSEMVQLAQAVHESADRLATLTAQLSWQGEFTEGVQAQLRALIADANELVTELYGV